MASQITVEGVYTTAERDALNTAFYQNTLVLHRDSTDTIRLQRWSGTAWVDTPTQNNPIFNGLTVTGAPASIQDGLSVSTDYLQLVNGATFAPIQGTDVASANDLDLTTGLAGGNTFEVTGATQINAIKNLVGTIGQEGMEVTLLFTSNPLVKHNTAGGGGTSPILLAGGVDFVAGAGDRLKLLRSELGGVSAWREVSRALVAATQTLTQTYSTADSTHAAFTSADLAAFAGGVTGFLDAAERDGVRTQFNALRADVADLKQFVNSLVDALQAKTIVG